MHGAKVGSILGMRWALFRLFIRCALSSPQTEGVVMVVIRSNGDVVHCASFRESLRELMIEELGRMNTKLAWNSPKAPS